MSPRAAWRLESLGFREVLDYRAGKADWGAAGLPLEGGLSDVPRVGPLAATDVPTCRLDERVDGVRHRATAAGWGVAVVVSDSRVVLGILRRRALEGRPEAPVDDVMAPGPSTFRPNVTAHELYHYLLDRGVNLALPPPPRERSSGRSTAKAWSARSVRRPSRGPGRADTW